MITILIISAFGPYVSNKIGLRVEHLLIYPLFILLLFKMAIRPVSLKFTKTIAFVLLLLLAATIWTFLVTCFVDNGVAYSKILSSAENYIQPIALIFVLVSIIPNDKRKILNYLETACFVIPVMLNINTIISIAQIFTDTWVFVKYFVRTDLITEFSVWRNSASMGRYCGIFNQPIEAGIAYSIGLGSWVYIISKEKRIDLMKIILLIGLLIGGFLTVSKAFILGGLPLVIIYLYFAIGLQYILKFKSFFKIFLVLIILVPLSLSLEKIWKGANFFSRLFNWDPSSGKSFLSFYTAGRFGSDQSTVIYLFLKTIQESPLNGFGFGAFSPLDNGYIEFFYQGGFVGLLFYAMILYYLFRHIFKNFNNSPDECRLLAFLMILVLGAGLGAPVLTINRSSILIWILIVLSVSASSIKKYQENYNSISLKNYKQAPCGRLRANGKPATHRG